MNEITNKINFQLKGFLCIILIASVLISSASIRFVSAVTLGPPTHSTQTALLSSNKSSNTCYESSTNLDGLKISTYLTGKTTTVQLKSDFSPHPSMQKVSKLVGNKLTSQDSIALVFPTFTAAAYYKSFYDFYRKHIDTSPGKNVTEDLDLLSSKVRNQISPVASGDSMLFLIKNLENMIPNLNLHLFSDQDVDNGCIFTNDGSNMVDVIILGHQEYVTQKEYYNLKQFVADGGTLILLDSNIFYAEVKYDNSTNKITFVKGHSWAFNGKSAWRSVNERWQNETSQWIGSNYLSISSATFLNDPFEYLHHEEQSITNPKDTILLDYKMANAPSHTATDKDMVAAYELNYIKGKVYSIGIYSDDVIHNLKFDKYLDDLLVQVTRSKTVDSHSLIDDRS
jgi:hypothetical protein